jgi:hypothetical protein
MMTAFAAIVTGSPPAVSRPPRRPPAAGVTIGGDDVGDGQVADLADRVDPGDPLRKVAATAGPVLGNRRSNSAAGNDRAPSPGRYGRCRAAPSRPAILPSRGCGRAPCSTAPLPGPRHRGRGRRPACRRDAPASRPDPRRRRRYRHLRHHRGAAAPDQTLVGSNTTRPCPRRGERGIHAGAAGTDDQDVGLEMHQTGGLKV